eukprot:5216405-Pyramimonas_sp.AAC.1
MESFQRSAFAELYGHHSTYSYSKFRAWRAGRTAVRMKRRCGQPPRGTNTTPDTVALGNQAKNEIRNCKFKLWRNKKFKNCPGKNK